jgi:hypothetical protein
MSHEQADHEEEEIDSCALLKDEPVRQLAGVFMYLFKGVFQGF